ncbi:MAG: MFS transporter [Burkholderiaceae bacterium]
MIAATYGWRAAFLSLAGVGLLWLLIWLPTWKLGPYGGEAAKNATYTDADKEPNVPWLKVLTSGTFLGAWLASMPVYAIVATVLTFLPSYFEKGLGFSRVQAGAMFGFPSIASMVTLVGMTYISDRLISRGSSSRLLRGIVPTIGIFLALQSLGGVYGPYLAGKIVQGAGNPLAGYPLAFQIFGAIALAGAVIALFSVNPERDKLRLRHIVS